MYTQPHPAFLPAQPQPLQIRAKEAEVAQEQSKLDADTAALRLKAKNLRKQVPDSWHRSGNDCSLPLLSNLTHGELGIPKNGGNAAQSESSRCF